MHDVTRNVCTCPYMELQERTLKPTDCTTQLEITDSASSECCGNDLVGKARFEIHGRIAESVIALIVTTESTDTPGRPAGRERTAASDAPELLRPCAASAARTRARARSQCHGPWQLKREGWHALHPDGRCERRTVLPTVPPPSAIAEPRRHHLSSLGTRFS